MPPIPAKLNARLHKVLAQCGPFDSHETLRAVFVDERLYSWRDAIPETATRADRIAALIDALHNKSTVAGDNALVLFLRVSGELVELTDNQCHCDLVSLANELERQIREIDSQLGQSLLDPNERIHRLLGHSREVLLKCVEFHSDSSLQAVFIDQRLSFECELPGANNISDRVDACIKYLENKRFDNDGRRVLPVFLTVLRDRYHDALRDELSDLIQDLQTAFIAADIEKTRRIDASAPSQAKVNERIEILVQVRFTDSPLLGISDRRTKSEPPSLERAHELITLQFPIDPRTGKVASARLAFRVVAPDFVVEDTSQRIVDVPPDKYSGCFPFLLTPIRTGNCEIRIEVHSIDEAYLNTIRIETVVGETDITQIRKVANLFLIMKIHTIAIPSHQVGDLQQVVLGLDEAKTNAQETIAWFANIGLIGNPFEHLTAEEDEALSRYQIQLQELRSLERQIRGDEAISRWIIFAKRGCGKTALCQMVRRSHYPFKKDQVLGIMFDAEALNNVLAYADHSLEILQPVHYIKVIEDMIPDSIKILKLTYPSGVNARQALSALTQVIVKQGFKYLLCLIDQIDDVELVEAQPEKMVQLLKPLMQLSQQTLPGVAFRYFLPDELESLMQAQHTAFRLDRYQIVHLRWTEEDLERLVAQRLTAFSKSVLNPYTSLGQLCEPGANFDAPVDLALVRLAEGSPRAAVWLANRLIQVHCQAENPPRFIQPATWQQVKADWRLYGRDQLFGSPARSEAFVLAGDCIYFQGEEVILSEKYDALLRCLIQAGDRVCTKEELIRAGWPGEEPEGVTEAALAEAVRRMKVELKKLGYDPGWVKNVRGRGYRLRKPKAPGVR